MWYSPRGMTRGLHHSTSEEYCRLNNVNIENNILKTRGNRKSTMSHANTGVARSSMTTMPFPMDGKGNFDRLSLVVWKSLPICAEPAGTQSLPAKFSLV